MLGGIQGRVRRGDARALQAQRPPGYNRKDVTEGRWLRARPDSQTGPSRPPEAGDRTLPALSRRSSSGGLCARKRRTAKGQDGEENEGQQREADAESPALAEVLRDIEGHQDPDDEAHERNEKQQ